MSEFQAATAALTSLKAAFDLTKTILDVAGSAKVRDQIIELQSKIIAAQSSAMEAQAAQAALIARVNELEAQLAKKEDWEGEKQRYELREIVSGGFAYVEKGSVRGAKGVQPFCQNCFEHGRKSVLNVTSLGELHYFQCGECPVKFGGR